MRKSLFGLFFLIGLSAFGQGEYFASTAKMQGIWQYIPSNKDDSSYLNVNIICHGNRSIMIIYHYEDKSVFILEKPFSYYGFWNSTNDKYPAHVSQLRESGNSILFYDEKGNSYDEDGKLHNYTRSYWVTYNEDANEPTKENYLRFYTTDTPDLYVQVQEIPKYVLEALKKNKESWDKYVRFMEK